MDKELQWLVPEEETQPIWEVFERIFRVPDPETELPFAADLPFFMKPGWTMVALVNNLKSLALPPYAPAEVREGLYATLEQWEEDREPLAEIGIEMERDGFYERDELGPMLDITSTEGARTLYFIESIGRRPGSLQAGEASRAGLEAAVRAIRQTTIGYGIVGNSVFDDTGRWGLYLDEDNVAIMAGEPTLMERYIPEVGGVEFLQQRFADRIRHQVDPESDLYWIGAARTFRLWYAYLRWPWPFPAPPL